MIQIDNGVKTLKGQVHSVSKEEICFRTPNCFLITYLPEKLQNLMDFKWIKDDPDWFWGWPIKGQGHIASTQEDSLLTITCFLYHLPA